MLESKFLPIKIAAPPLLAVQYLFDFVGPTFEPVPVIGGFFRWLYRQFVA